MYCLLVAHVTNFFAASCDFDVFGIASDHDHSQCEPFGVTAGYRHKPTADLALAIDFDALLARVLAPVHLGFESKLAQNLTTAAGQRLSNMVTRKFLRLDDYRLDSFPRQEHGARRAGPGTVPRRG